MFIRHTVNFMQISLAFLMIGCTAFNSVSYQMGPLLTEKEISKIKKTDHKSTILAELGTPSFECPENPDQSICYFYQKRIHDSIQDQRLIQIYFDKQGNASKIIIHEK
jgi:outer membrane protein assembly factor BamE (lipoprotein component of BamABCDE complex)